MHLPGLQRLHTSMQSVGIDRIQFQLTHNHLTFAGVFLADVSPFELAFGAIGHEFVLIYEVDGQYNALAYIKDAAVLEALKSALNTGQGSGHAFNPGQFLREIDDALPKHANPNHVPSYADVVRVYRYVEEANKVHFSGWHNNNIRGEKVRPKNLAKSRRLLGQQTHDFCKRNNLSSCWSDIAPTKLIAPTLPSGPGYK